MTFHESFERTKTDGFSFKLCFGLVVISCYILIYASNYSNISRISMGYDNCGNVCGEDSGRDTTLQCGDHNKINETLLEINVNIDSDLTNETRKCVKECDAGFTKIAERCYDSEHLKVKKIKEDISVQLSKHLWPILIVCLATMALSYTILLLLRYAVKYVFHVVCSLFVLLLVVGATSFCMSFIADGSAGNLLVAGMFAVAAGFTIFSIYCYRKNVDLVIQLFEEASKVLLDLPVLLVEPILTFITLLLSFFIFIYFTLMIESSGRFEDINREHNSTLIQAEYGKDIIMVASRAVNAIAFYWFISLILGCQHFIIASTVCQWYFSQNKIKLEAPLKKAFSHLMNFHLGSVCLGSIVIPVMKIISTIVYGVNNKFSFRCNVPEALEDMLKYFVRNAYIVVAKDGTPLMDSGKKVLTLHTKHIADCIAVNWLGDFVLVLAKICITLAGGFIAYITMNVDELNLPVIPIVIGTLFSFLIGHCFITVYEMTISTIFVCFCEDCEENDGQKRDHYMSAGLMNIMQEMKSSAGKETFLNPQDHENGPRPILPPADWIPNPEYDSTAHMAQKQEPTAPSTESSPAAPPKAEWNLTAPPANWNPDQQQ